MKTYIIDYDLDSTLTTVNDKWVDFMENTICPILNGYNNITYLGMASNNNGYKEAVFQIGNYENFYLRLCKDNRVNWGGPNYPYIRISTSADLTVCNSFINYNNFYGGSANQLVTNETNIKCNMYTITDENNNLRAMWQIKSPNAVISGSQGFYITEDEDENDVFVVIGPSTYVSSVFYMGDENNTRYMIPNETIIYQDPTRLLRKNWHPITSNGAVSTTLGNLSKRTMRIFNSDLGADENANNKDSTQIRKLIQIGTKKYRQMVSTYWIEDPLGDETPIEITRQNHPAISPVVSP